MVCQPFPLLHSLVLFTLSLVLSPSELTSFPSSIGNLQELRKIDVCSNKLSTFPDTSAMSGLSWLDLGDNQFTTLPPTIFTTPNLTFLNLFGNQLSSLPPELDKLVQLKKLYLGYNQLDDSSFPDDSFFSSLVQLEELFLGGNLLTTLPNCLANLSSLTELCCSNCRLLDLPGSVIGALSKLKHLHLTCNQLTSLPPELGSLSSLAEVPSLPSLFSSWCFSACSHSFRSWMSHTIKSKKFRLRSPT